MKERPVLFSAPMVRAILDGRKTQTRRVVKPPRERFSEYLGTEKDCDFGFFFGVHGSPEYCDVKCPYGKPGDRLWVRETWKTTLHTPGYDNGTDQGGHHDFDGGIATVIYRAGGDLITVKELEEREDHQAARGLFAWKPSIHMPRWASRITLEITGVRVERLNDISEEDSYSEGIRCSAPDDDPRCNFFRLWESINGSGSWQKNPCVWVIEFKRLNTGNGEI